MSVSLAAEQLLEIVENKKAEENTDKQGMWHFAQGYFGHIMYIIYVWTLICHCIKDKSKVRGDFWHFLPLKLAENDDVGETVIWGL